MEQLNPDPCLTEFIVGDYADPIRCSFKYLFHSFNVGTHDGCLYANALIQFHQFWCPIPKNTAFGSTYWFGTDLHLRHGRLSDMTNASPCCLLVANVMCVCRHAGNCPWAFEKNFSNYKRGTLWQHKSQWENVWMDWNTVFDPKSSVPVELNFWIRTGWRSQRIPDNMLALIIGSFYWSDPFVGDSGAALSELNFIIYFCCWNWGSRNYRFIF